MEVAAGEGTFRQIVPKPTHRPKGMHKPRTHNKLVTREKTIEERQRPKQRKSLPGLRLHSRDGRI